MTLPLPTGEGLPARRLRICIVTFELVGFWKNGGIGTVSTGMAELLAKAGHEVTVALTRADALSEAEFAEAAKRYEAQGIRIAPLRGATTPAVCGPLASFTGWERFAAYEFLRRSDFDIVHASEHLGELFYAISAKRLGLAFQRTTFVVGVHGSSRWVIQANDAAVRDPFWIWCDATERACLRHADVVWAASRYMLDWMRDNGLETPADRTYFQPYRIPDDLGPVRDRPRPPPGTRQPIQEIVFFGRLETRKGLQLFLNAITSLAAELHDVRVVFMGRVGEIDGEPADTLIARRMSGLGIAWEILSSFDRFEAYSYVTKPGHLVVAASPVDNSPCAIYELLEVGASLIACRGGGVPEIIAPEWHEDVLFDYTLSAIVERLRHCLEFGAIAPTLAFDRQTTEAAWLGAHLALAAPPRTAMDPALPKLVPAVTLVLHDGVPAALAETISSLRACGELVRSIVIVHSERRGSPPVSLYPDLARRSLDVLGASVVLTEAADWAAPCLVLRAGARIAKADLARLLRAGPAADAVIPFIRLDDESGTPRVELTLADCVPWAVLHGACRTGGLLSTNALRHLAQAPPPGSDIMLWFDRAITLGLTVMTLPEALIDGTRGDRTSHMMQDERARLDLWSGQVPVDFRMLMEAAYGFYTTAPPLPLPAVPSPAEAVLPVPIPVPIPVPAGPDPSDLFLYQSRLRARSFRIGKAFARLAGQPVSLPSEPHTADELRAAHQGLLSSAAWDAGGAVRVIGRLARRLYSHYGNRP